MTTKTATTISTVTTTKTDMKKKTKTTTATTTQTTTNITQLCDTIEDNLVQIMIVSLQDLITILSNQSDNIRIMSGQY